MWTEKKISKCVTEKFLCVPLLLTPKRIVTRDVAVELPIQVPNTRLMNFCGGVSQNKALRDVFMTVAVTCSLKVKFSEQDL